MPLLDFDDNDLRVLNQALLAQPYGLVAPLVNKINQQLRTPAAEQSPDEANHEFAGDLGYTR